MHMAYEMLSHFPVAMRRLISFLRPLACVQLGGALCSSANPVHLCNVRIILKIFILPEVGFWLIYPICMYLRVFLVVSRHISVWFYVCEITRRAFDVLPECENWPQTFYNAYPVKKEAVVMKFHVSFHVKAKHRRHIASFHEHEIKPKFV